MDKQKGEGRAAHTSESRDLCAGLPEKGRGKVVWVVRENKREETGSRSRGCGGSGPRRVGGGD